MSNKNEKNKTEIRRGQLITTFGIGSIISTPENESLIVESNAYWNYENMNDPENIIREDRLINRLKVSHLRYPPAQENEAAKGSKNTISAARFPLWHYCKFCHHMRKFEPFEKMKQCANRECKSHENPINSTYIPVRFIAACDSGHIQDIPFIEFLHQGQNLNDHQLKYSVGSKTSLDNIYIECITCGAKNHMGNIIQSGQIKKITNKGCQGNHPWHRESREENECNDPLKVVQKGASNVYFPVIMSSIYIPDKETAVPESVKEWINNPTNRDVMEGFFADEEENIELIKNFLLSAIEGLEDVDSAFNYVKQEINGENVRFSAPEEKEFRFEEYEVLKNYQGPCGNDYHANIQKTEIYEPFVGDWFSGISILEKVRETRAFIGFTRIRPWDGSRTVNELKKQLHPTCDWLPADVIRGEGIFLEFNQEKMIAWESQEIIKGRFNSMKENFELKFSENKLGTMLLPRYILMHTFAHALIREVAIECGYGTSSLKERIYSGNVEGKYMGGILIYTASGDSEGSLGGLVNLAKEGTFERILRNTIEKSKWCSTDPVCSTIGSQGPFKINMAACHNCSILPETACEQMNLLLDRTMMIGTFEEPSIGYFS